MPSGKQVAIILVLVVVGIAIVFRSPLKRVVTGA